MSILDIYEIKQSFDNARDYTGELNYPNATINDCLKILKNELSAKTLDMDSIARTVKILDSHLDTSYHWWRFYRLNEKLNELFNLNITLRRMP